VLHVYSEVIDSTVYAMLAAGLRDLGVVVEHVMTSSESAPLEKRLRGQGQTVHSISESHGTIGRLRRLRLVVKDTEPQLVVAFGQTANLLTAVPRLWRGRELSIGTRFHSDYHTHRYRLRGRLYDLVTAHSHRGVIVPSSGVREWMVTHDRARKERVFIAPFGLDLEDFKRVPSERSQQIRLKHGIPNDAILVVASARPVVPKGLTYLFEAIARLQDRPEYSSLFLLVSNWRGHVDREVELALSNLDPSRVVLVSREEDYPALISGADIFVHVPVGPYAEGFGQVYLEALAAGRPCVFTRSGVLSDAPTLRGAYIDVPYGSSDALQESMESLLRDPALRGTLAGLALDRCESANSEAMAEQYAAIYREILGREAHPNGN